MALQPDIITRPGPSPAPLTYELGTTEVLRPVAAFAHWDGSGASGAFLPCLSLYAQDGTLFSRTFPSSSVAQGGVADVSYAPFPGGIGTGNGTTGDTVQVLIPLDTPDNNGAGYPALTVNNGFSNVRRLVPAFTHGGGNDSTWEGSLVVPEDYLGSPSIILSGVANATSGVVRTRVGTKVVAAGASEDGAYTQESFVNTTVPGTANVRHDITFALSTSPAAGASLNVMVTRNNSSGTDTLAVDWLLWACVFQYASSRV